MNRDNILETVRMIQDENLDIRTITMGITLFDCTDPDGKKARQKIYQKIVRLAGDLVKTGESIEEEYGIPIINKRIAVTPLCLIAPATGEEDYVAFAETLDRSAKEVGVDFIGGFSAIVQKGCSRGDRILLDSIPQAMSCTDVVCSSVCVGTTRAGLNMDVVREMGRIIKETARLTADHNSIGCAKMTVFANAVDDNPFMAGAFTGIGEAECSINVGISGPGVIRSAVEKVKGQSFEVLAETIKKMAFKITRAGQLVAQETSKRLGVSFGIVDLSLAPTPRTGDSIANILEMMGLESCGTHGTTAALALLTDCVKKGGLMACSHAGGLSGAFIPVSEDAGMIEAVNRGSINIDKLEAMTCVCSVGLDMIAVPGDTPEETISAIIADEASIGIVNNKTTSVRIIPVFGRNAGEKVEFGGLLGRAPIMAVNPYSSRDFIRRSGRIPAPLHSYRN
ncbi:MAG: PFL family protein [Dehalococcoidales bacterium]|nr:PFL family protein [Dehalococcoidales bacterium]